MRVSLILPNNLKGDEVDAGHEIISDIYVRRVRSVAMIDPDKLNNISYPSCSRVENEAFIDLAQDVKEMTQYAGDHNITIAVWGAG